MVLCLAKEVVNFLKFNPTKNAQSAAEYGVNLLDSVHAPGGLICVDNKGGIGFAHNTAHMTVHSL
jgi:isoaspartyl peptidase/L-asparaginase-like protein (Ntn-hydrolase superfamily)